MRKFIIGLAMAVPLSVTALHGTPAHAERTAEQPQSTTVQLTEQQKNELSILHKDIFEKRKEVISKYVEYGIFTEEKGKKIISHLEQHYAELEKNGYVPRYERHKRSHHQ